MRSSRMPGESVEAFYLHGAPSPIRARTPREQSCTCKARSSAPGRAWRASAVWRRRSRCGLATTPGGSMVEPFVSVVMLQLAEGGRLSLDARLAEVLPADVVGRFANSGDITVRMLLGHRAGIPDWDGAGDRRAAVLRIGASARRPSAKSPRDPCRQLAERESRAAQRAGLRERDPTCRSRETAEAAADAPGTRRCCPDRPRPHRAPP